MASDDSNRIDQVPTFSRDERDRRWANIRSQMALRDIDCLLIWGNNHNRGIGNASLRYVTQVPGASSGIGLFPLDGEPAVWTEMHHMHVPDSPYDRYQNWIDDTRPYDGIEAVIDEVTSRGLDSGRVGIVHYGNMFAREFAIPYPDFEALSRGLSNAQLIDATGLVERERLIKSDEEIEMLRRAGEVGRAMARALMDADPGQKECDVFADMMRARIENGGEPFVSNFFDSGAPADSSPQHLLHGKPEPLAPTTRTLNEGDVIVTEYHAAYGGTMVGVEKSVVLGSAPGELMDVHEVSLECLESGLGALTPGTSFGDVVDAIRRPAREAGMDYVELGLHGHGFGSPEFPATVYPQQETVTYPDGMADERLSGGGMEDVRLEEGMVFATNIDVYDPDWRNDVGLMFGDTILVTEDGPEKLVDTPTDLVV